MTARWLAYVCGFGIVLGAWAEEQAPELDFSIEPTPEESIELELSEESPEPESPAQAPEMVFPEEMGLSGEVGPPEPEGLRETEPTEEPTIAEVNVSRILMHITELEAGLKALREEVAGLQAGAAPLMEQPAKPIEETVGLPMSVEEEADLSLALREGVLDESLDESQDGPEPVQPVASQQPVYDPATWMFKRGKTAFRDFDFYNSAQIFERFLEQYPNHEEAGNARYWLGEIAYEQGDFSTAVEYLQQVVDSGSSPHHLVAYLKIGYSQFELGEYDQAKEILSEVQEQAPGSNLARLAQLRLERLDRLERQTDDE